jgi:hypothetical protein
MTDNSIEIKDIENFEDWCQMKINSLELIEAYVEYPDHELFIHEHDFQKLIKAVVIIGKAKSLVFKNCRFNFRVDLNDDLHIDKGEDISGSEVSQFHGLQLENDEQSFKNLRFEFNYCKFPSSISLDDYEYNEKIKFRLCQFEQFEITNSTFNEYAEFYDCTFLNKVIFAKCSFNKNVVFTKSTFNDNCMFTYSTFEKLGIFSRVRFVNEKDDPTGLDLSQSVINGQLTFFETVLKDFKAYNIQSTSFNFDKTVVEGDVIPLQNKRETFRIIKHQLLQQNNIIESEKYAKLEKQTLLDEMTKDFKGQNIPNLLLLLANKLSNNYKTNWFYGLVFTISLAFMCHSILSISDIYKFTDFINIFKLINLADFSIYEKDISTEFYAVYFIAKIFIGFGIYQTIQAFRKYK